LASRLLTRVQFLVLTLGDSRNTTQYVPKTLNPEWNHICEMPVSGITCLLLDCVCWDKDRFGKDYLGEFELALEDIFANEKMEQPAKWYPLKSRRTGHKKSSYVSGEVQLQFTLYDTSTPGTTSLQVMEKFWSIAGIEPELLTPTKSGQGTNGTGVQRDEEEDEDMDEEEEPSDETEDPSKPETVEKRRRRMRIKGLKKRKQHQLYAFSGDSDVMGIVFLEIGKITDLPPEKNLTRTSFDMDPFVVASLGKKTYRTRVIRHNLNPVFNEKMIFQVLRHEQSYSISFTVIDRDKLSGNDFIASTAVPLPDITSKAPKADPETGLYELRDPPDSSTIPKSKGRFKISLSRSSSSQSLSKLARPGLTTRHSSSMLHQVQSDIGPQLSPVTSNPIPSGDPNSPLGPGDNGNGSDDHGDPDLHAFTIPLQLKNKEKWEEKHSPELFIKAKYLPYPALRQQFWRAMLKQYDTDESGCISKIELTTMLDTLGSTLKESTIDSFFQRFPHRTSGEDTWDLSMDEAVICLEDQLYVKSKQSTTDKVKDMLPDSTMIKHLIPPILGGAVAEIPSSSSPSMAPTGWSTPSEATTPLFNEQERLGVDIQNVDDFGAGGEEGEYLDRDDLNDRGEEHVVEIKECPICHQPRLNRRSDADIITHIATCASQDWRQVNNIVMAGFVTSSQAQRKWYSKVITKISYGGYKLGANSANILVQDRITGQINEERMSIYVRLGIRLLYKGLKSREMEKKRSMWRSNIYSFSPGSIKNIANRNAVRKLLRGLSVKQGIKYDDPASKNEIQKFIQFHQLDMSEVLLPVDHFKNFNEFFYRQLKPDARPCSAPDNPRIIVSPADCRSVVFNKIDEATRIWVKGREFSIERLLGNTYPEDSKRYTNGALGIFRLAPQDYHRFHIPVDGIMGVPKTIEGEYYTVNPMAIRSALDVYGENVRIVVPIDSVAHGRVMVVCVGAMMVGSTIITRRAGEHVARAEELGYFKFGGSTLLVLFEPGTMKFDDDLVDNSQGALETLVSVHTSFQQLRIIPPPGVLCS
jgi:phosphatidylserine decarboxylase